MKFYKETDISFEVFPPKIVEDFHKIHQLFQTFEQYNPAYFSVTFGAGGSLQLKTQQLVHQLANAKISTAPHISCRDMTKIRVAHMLEEYTQLGIRHLVVIQGDLSAQQEGEQQDFHYACELVEYIREITDHYFHIHVAAYPEYHPHAKNSAIDLENFKNKINAGANSAITQFFFNSDAYFRFIDACAKQKINIPIIPGIMPIHDYLKLTRFAAACGAEIPLWLRKQFETYSGDALAVKEIGIEVVTKLCETLLINGVSALHFYTLNQIEPTATIINNLGLEQQNREFNSDISYLNIARV